LLKNIAPNLVDLIIFFLKDVPGRRTFWQVSGKQRETFLPFIVCLFLIRHLEKGTLSQKNMAGETARESGGPMTTEPSGLHVDSPSTADRPITDAGI
jgi:hypothetical protein